ncbi:Imidazolonepropionase [Massilia sp. Bi118]|uniref:CIA30 family protein n=1 Tax=Massilia sp. Bi118 TaxID=2822346 RepID=UPI001D39A1DA|nr:CIA30 family protein [Massilia sp. Bi118]CAH0155170.1 Imidazolonepropionase [Massilia sp. Bi118]
MKPTILASLFLAAGLASASAFAGTTLVQDVRVFDGKSAHEHRSVLVRDGLIADSDYRGMAPEGSRVVDGKGRTLLPGLIDAHVHTWQHFELPLVFGVTTQVDMFTGVEVMQRIRQQMASGRNGGEADVFSAGTLVTAPGGHGTEYPVKIPTLENGGDAQAFVDARIAEGSHFIKVVMEDGFGEHHFHSFDRATVKAVIAAAHKRGKLAVVHISNLENARAALEAGADGLAHLFVAEKLSQEQADSLARLAQAKGAFVVPTFSVLESMAGVKPRDLLEDPQVTGLLDREERGALQTGYGPSPRPAILAAPKMVTAAMRRAGVPLLAGTDAGNAGTQYGASLHHEMAALVDAGLSPREALVAATSAPAKAFRLGQRGQIAKGYKADLVLVEGNPLQDIAATRRIVEVWKDGESTAAIREAQFRHVAQESSAKGASPAALPADGRISLLKDGKLASPFGTGWIPSSDKFAGGVSTVNLGTQSASEGGAAIAIDAKVKPGFAYPWAGAAFMPGTQPMQGADLSAAKLIRFRVRGDGQKYTVTMASSGMTIPRSVLFDTGAEWKEVTIPFSAFAGVDPAAVIMIGFNAGPQPGDYRFEIADVRLVDR